MHNRMRGLTLATLIVAVGAACAGSQDLNGAGATFPYPIYSKWFSDYARQTGVRINYQSIGSGGGIRQLTAGTVDFGASDAPMTDSEMAKLPSPVLHFPTVLGAVVVTYNLTGLNEPLELSGPVLADVFLGKITKWNDSRIAALNPGVKLPATDILVVHRSDGSGTTYIFSDYLSAVSPAWQNGPGRGKELAWPTGLGAKGNEGVAGQVKQMPGSIGYVELAYAKQNGLAYASIENAAGKMVAPTIESVTSAAAGTASNLPEDTDYRISIVNAPGADAYPISSFTYLLVYANQRDSKKAEALLGFLGWYLREGEKSAASLDYAPLPPSIVSQLEKRIGTITVAGK